MFSFAFSIKIILDWFVSISSVSSVFNVICEKLKYKKSPVFPGEYKKITIRKNLFAMEDVMKMEGLVSE